MNAFNPFFVSFGFDILLFKQTQIFIYLIFIATWKCYMQSARRKCIAHNSSHFSIIEMLLFTTAIS